MEGFNDMFRQRCVGFTIFSIYLFLTEENIKELSRFSKNYLPILFNIYTSCEEKNDSVSLPILQTLKCYLQITDQKVAYKICASDAKSNLLLLVIFHRKSYSIWFTEDELSNGLSAFLLSADKTVLSKSSGESEAR